MYGAWVQSEKSMTIPDPLNGEPFIQASTAGQDANRCGTSLLGSTRSPKRWASVRLRLGGASVVPVAPLPPRSASL